MMPAKPSNLNVFILQRRYLSVSQPWCVCGILQPYLRVGSLSLFRDKRCGPASRNRFQTRRQSVLATTVVAFCRGVLNIVDIRPLFCNGARSLESLGSNAATERRDYSKRALWR